jgi:PiT family inorganic phosphate transporter
VLLMIVLLIVLTLVLAFANGANDVSKGIATLVGSGVSKYRSAVLWGALCTVAGALTASFASQALVATFSGKDILVQPASAASFLLAVAIGAIGWLSIATWTGLPVSTTHSLAGALAGAAIVSAGVHGVVWTAIGGKIALPLIASPLISLILLIAVLPLVQPLFKRFDRYCVCVEQRDVVAVTPEGVSFRESLATLEVAPAESCATAVARFSAIDTLHWISSGATSFFRGLNDTPKILALGIAAAATIGVSTAPAYAAVALAMGSGSLIAGFRVTRTLAEKITPITPANGFAANVVTSILVGLASTFALPVSTTHVSSGAIIGAGLAKGGRCVRWKTAGELLLAWLVTLPVSALIAAAALSTLR